VFLALVTLLVVRVNRSMGSLRRAEPTSWQKDMTADCGIVLTGGRGRIREGFDLLYRKQIQKLIISGVHSQATLYDLLPVWPYYGKLNEGDVIIDRRSHTTYGNAQQTLPIAETLRCRDVLLITSTLHMTRAYKTFRKAYPPEIAIYPYSLVANRYPPTWADAAVETAKLFFYSLWAF
jgi:uncharacterized SAM-binding protein YcdF (DUF218 family)